MNTTVSITSEPSDPGVGGYQLERLFQYLSECYWGEPVTEEIQIREGVAYCSLVVGTQESSFELVWRDGDWIDRQEL
jgi:hypothetical protein